MTDTILIAKAASIERCVRRVREGYEKGPETFARDPTRQDAAVMNLMRAGAAALVMGRHVVRRDRLGAPQSAEDVFSLLEAAGRLPPVAADRLRKAIDLRNIAIDEDPARLVAAALRGPLDDLLVFSRSLLERAP